SPLWYVVDTGGKEAFDQQGERVPLSEGSERDFSSVSVHDHGRNRIPSQSVNSHVSDSNQIKSPHVHDDQIGKPFLVVDQNTRRCLVCDELLTRRQAPEHAKVICYPRT